MKSVFSYRSNYALMSRKRRWLSQSRKDLATLHYASQEKVRRTRRTSQYKCIFVPLRNQQVILRMHKMTHKSSIKYHEYNNLREFSLPISPIISLLQNSEVSSLKVAGL